MSFLECESALIVGKRAAWTWTSIDSWKATVLQSLAPNPTPEPANQGFQDLQKCILGKMEQNSAKRWPCRTRTGQKWIHRLWESHTGLEQGWFIFWVNYYINFWLFAVSITVIANWLTTPIGRCLQFKCPVFERTDVGLFCQNKQIQTKIHSYIKTN